MRKLAIVLALLPMVACSTTSSAAPTAEQQQRGIKSVSALSSDYASGAYWSSLERSADGRSNAFARDMNQVGTFFDRHFWNYDANDPYVNFPTDATRIGHTGRSVLSGVSAIPIVGDIWDMFR